MKHTFKKAVLSEDEKLWMTTVYQSQDFDARKTKVKLLGKITKDFDPYKIDQRFYRSNNLTLIGLWLVDSESKIFNQVHRVICKIKEMIKAVPDINQVSAKELAQKLGIEEAEVGIALALMSELGDFTSGGTSNGRGFDSINFSSSFNGYDAYLEYENLDDSMEKFYVRKLSPPFNIGRLKTNIFAGNSMDLDVSAEIKPNTAFIIMPINPDDALMVDVYNGIKDVCAKFGIQAVRADDIEHEKSITEEILKQIRECAFLIADLSHERPNVYYEIGYAHAINKHPILYRHKSTKLHFDLAVHNVPEYKNSTELKVMLEKRFEAILGRKAK